MKEKIKTDYMSPIYNLNVYSQLLPAMAKRLKAFKKKNKFQALAFTGCSGAAVAYPLSFLLKIPLICIRKKDDNTHSSCKAEGAINAEKYLIVDDFISTGKTVRRIASKLNGELVGIFLYNAYDRKIKVKNQMIPVIGCGDIMDNLEYDGET